MHNYEHFLLYNNDRTDKELYIEIDGSGASIITNEIIHNGQFTLEESICSESELRFGGCESSKVQFKINNIFPSLKDRWITVKQIIDGNEEDPVQIGVFKIYSDKLTADRKHKDIVAYDRMYDIVNTDITEWYNGIVFPIQIGELRNLLFEKLGVTQQDTVLINDLSAVDKTDYNGKVAAGDLLKDICELNACFGKMNRDDVFTYISLYDVVSDTKTKSDYSDVQYEDFETKKIDRLLITQGSIDTDYYVGDGTNTYTITPRLLKLSDNNLQAIGENILANIKWITYVPTSIDCRGNPCLECGDMISFISGDNVEIKTFILERKLSGIKVLKDTYLSNGTEYYLDIDTNSSNISGNINSGISSVYKNTMYALAYTNSQLYEISSTEQTVQKYNLSVTADSEVIVVITIPFYANLDGVIQLNYYVDAELKEGQTIKKYFNRGNNVLSVCNYVTLKKNDRITLSIGLKSMYFESDKRISDAKIISLENYVNSGNYSLVDIDMTIPKITIEKEAIRSFVIGKGLVEAVAQWDGTINLVDKFGYIPLSNMPVNEFTDSVMIGKLNPTTVGSISEGFGFITSNISIVGINDSMIVNEVVDNYTFSTDKAEFYEYDTERVTTDGVFALNSNYSDAQIVISNAINLEHSSIYGIESATAVCTGTLAMAISTDKATWKAHNGTQWVTLSDNYSGMSKEQLEAVTVDQWNEVITSDITQMYIRIALTDTTQTVEKIVIDFAN